MQDNCTNENVNIYYACRKLTGMSRERAAMLLNIHESTLRNHECGITKSIPVETIVAMSELYNAPQLKTMCCKECPIGKSMPYATQIKPSESIALKLISQLDDGAIKNIKSTAAEIFADGVIDEHEKQDFDSILKWAKYMFEIITELMIFGEKEVS